MARRARRARLLASLVEAFYIILAVSPVASDMTDNLDLLWGNTQVEYDSSGRQTVSLSLDRWTTSAFRSKSMHLFGRFDMDIKLVPRDSAGTITTLYVSDPEVNLLDFMPLMLLVCRC